MQQIREDVKIAESDVREAKREFAEGAFAPFWDAVERAANRLSEAESCINQISNYSRQYGWYVAKLDSTPPYFHVRLDALPDTRRVAAELHEVVRMAQKNFQFSTIFEQRKTNRLLKGGFSNLAQALSEVGNRLDESMGTLAEAILEVAESDRANTEELVSHVVTIQTAIASESGERREHEKIQRAMLDNIQRRRKPRNF